MAQDLGNYGNKQTRERVLFQNFCLVTFGQNSGNNGFNVIIQNTLQASVICSLEQDSSSELR